MPTYEYVCAKCSHEFEAFQPMSEAPLSKCPKCKKGRVRRLISGGAGVMFKGSGFYETDYKRKSSAPSKAGAKEGASAKDAGGAKPCCKNCDGSGAGACASGGN